MVDVPQIQSSLNRYKFSFLALAILGTVSTFYLMNTEDVGFLGENVSRELGGSKRSAAWKKLMQKKRDKKEARKKWLKNNMKKKRLNAIRAKRKRTMEARADFQAHLEARKKLVWCMSYPFGGVDWIMKSVEYATGKSMATMYGDEVYDEYFQLVPQTTKPRLLYKRQLVKGPWLSNAVLPPPTSERVFVKTYCGGFCTWDGPLRCRKDYEYFKGLGAVDKFTDMCINGKKRGPFLKKLYGKTAVDGAVAIIRDPVELVLARFRDYAIKGKYEYTTSGLYKYCAWNDRFFDSVSQMEAMTKSSDVKSYFEEGVTPPPCYSEFYRILMWQSNAVDVVKRKNGLIFYWEDLTNRRNLENAVKEIMDYMSMTRDKNALYQFDPQFENPDLSAASFEDEDLVKIKNWMSAASPGIGRESLQKYFET